MSIIDDFVDFIYPQLCVGCGNILYIGEKFLCTNCMLHLPYTNYEAEKENPVFRNLYGRIPLNHASSLFFFNNGGCVQHLLHLLKYDKKNEIGLFLGCMMGQKLSASPFYDTVDYIVPLPIHPKKLKKRGYNQSEVLASGILKTWKTKYEQPKILTNLLYKATENETQTKKTREERWANVQNVFGINPVCELNNNNDNTPSSTHLLLIDDVLTTGATLESAATTLLSLSNIKLSIATAASPVY